MNERLAALLFALTGRKPVGFTDYNAPSTEKKVSAEQVEETRSIITPTGPVTAQPGDWEIRHEDGNVEKLSDEEFKERYGGGSSDSSDKESATEDGTTGEKDSALSTETPKSKVRDSSRKGTESQDDSSEEKGKLSEEKGEKDDELPL